eukprot:SAG31_NODE_2154_length_6312_cov_3.684050_4_plen_146_part_00
MSECTGATTWSTDTCHKWGSCGFAMPGTEVAVLDMKGNHVPPAVDPGHPTEAEQGELCYRGRHIMMGYLVCFLTNMIGRSFLPSFCIHTHSSVSGRRIRSLAQNMSPKLKRRLRKQSIKTGGCTRETRAAWMHRECSASQVATKN